MGTEHTPRAHGALGRLRAVPGRALRTAVRFVRDRYGATAIQALVFLPVILFAFVVSIKLWETVLIRRSLHTGTYLAMRYLALYPPDPPLTDVWGNVARELVYAELKNSPFVDRTKLIDVFAPVEVSFSEVDCGSEFTVRSAVTVFNVPVGGGQEIFPGLVNIKLREEIKGEVICD